MKPLIFIDVVDFATLQLHFLYIFVAAKRIDFVASATNSGEKGLLLEHRRAMKDVLIDVLEAIVAHASDQEPASDVLILLQRQWSLALGSTINIHAREVAGELTLVFRY